jgi:hypothetical protein
LSRKTCPGERELLDYHGGTETLRKFFVTEP